MSQYSTYPYFDETEEEFEDYMERKKQELDKIRSGEKY